MPGRKSYARWTKKDREIVDQYLEKHLGTGVSIMQLAKELSVKLERSIEGVVAEIYKQRKERRDKNASVK